MMRRLVTASLLLAASLPALALKSDTTQEIHITSATQSVDMQKNIITFKGNVAIKQGSINITADRVIVTRPNENQNSEIIEAFGNPVRFSQMQDNGKLVKGHSQKLRYDLKLERLTLIGNASLEQQGSSVQSNEIIYLVKEQRMEASGSGSKPVVTVLNPVQLQDKGTTPTKSSTNK